MAIAFFIFCDFFLQLKIKICCESRKSKTIREFTIYREIQLIGRFFYFYATFKQQLKPKGYLIGPRNSKPRTILKSASAYPKKITSAFF
jgi:hypothetical protein